MKPCTACGLDIDLIGSRHRCIPRPTNHIAAAANRPPAANTAAANNETAANAPASYARWRIRDVEKRRTYMRDHMRKLRAELKRQQIGKD